MRVCAKCKTSKSLIEFNFRNKVKGWYSSYCIDCAKKKQRDCRQSEKGKNAQKMYAEKNNEKITQYHLNYVKEHKEKIANYMEKYNKEWNSANKERRKEIDASYNRKHAGKRNARNAARNARKLNATPKWLDREHLDCIIGIYDKAKISGLEVDHIIPLKNELVSGLHVPWNLQLLTERENILKSNKFNGTYENRIQPRGALCQK